MSQSHQFTGHLTWTGKAAAGADGKPVLPRAFTLEFDGKAPLDGSSPGVFNGDDRLHNPETLMVSSIMSCHHLTYLAICERAGIALAAYNDRATGTLAIKDGKMRMVEVVLRPQVKVAEAAHIERALGLHDKAHANCFMSNSVNFEVTVEPGIG